jgi:type IV secretion system protein VirB6
MLSYYQNSFMILSNIRRISCNILLIATLLIISLFFSGCTGDRCIDADDFGFIKLTISARDKDRDKAKNSANNLQDNQIAPWIDSGFKVNGAPLTIMVRIWDQEQYGNIPSELSAWCPWFGTADHTETLSDFCERLRECEFISDMCTNTKDAAIQNAPCILKNGVGLYAFISKNNAQNPNSSFVTQANPGDITLHIGDNRRGIYELYDIDKQGNLRVAGGVRYNYEEYQDKTSTKIYTNPHTNGSLFFKILDKFYDDNNGQYRVVIKSGIFDTRPDPLDFLTKLVKEQFFGVDENKQGLVQKIYQNIVANPGYKLSVSAMLTLYIMFTALSFLIGNLNITHTELIVRVVKIAIVSALLNTNYSWSFFNDYLFQYFVGGVEQIIKMITVAANSGPGPSSIINLMVAPQTMAKLFSLLFIDWMGWLYIILFFIALYFAFMMMFEATIIYLTALITIGMIIIMGPIFICFLLFDITRSLFENWLKQLISYSIQPIILFTGLAFMSNIISTEIYNSLGFAVCKYDFPNLGNLNEIMGGVQKSVDSSLTKSIFYWWFPASVLNKGFATEKHEGASGPVTSGGTPPLEYIKRKIPVPIDHYKMVNGDEQLCRAFECVEERYIELPFLDPEKDIHRINSFFTGNYVQFDGLLIIFLAIYLLGKFNQLSISIASFLANTSGNLTSLQKAGNSAFTSFREGTAKLVDKGINAVGETNPRLATAMRIAFRPMDSTYKGVVDILSAVSDKVAKGYEDMQFQRLRNKALTKDANTAVLEEVKRTYGLEQKDIKLDAIKNYEAGLTKALKSINPNMGQEDFNKHLESLSQKDYAKLKDEFAKILDENGKPLDKTKLDELIKRENLRDLANEAKLTSDFQEAYVAAHQDLSKRGVGFFGKNIAVLRSLEEMKHRADETQVIRTAKRANLGQRLYAGYEGLKRGAFTAITGESLRDTLEGTMTGAAWHDFERSDPRLRTYSEQLQDEKRDVEFRELRKLINIETVSKGNDILSPEYLAKIESQGRGNEADGYRYLSRKKLSYEIYDALKAGSDPALMGEKFMRERATDEDFKEMIDKTYEVQSKLLHEDRYIRREDYYDNMHQKSIEDIQMLYKGLSEHYGREDIKVEEMPLLLEKYYDQPDAADLFAGKSVDYFKKSLDNFDYTKRVLEEIDQRKAQIHEEIAGYVDNINEYRKEAKMQEYKKPVIPQTRKLRSIEQHLPKK